jgi:hypothetical protein
VTVIEVDRPDRKARRQKASPTRSTAQSPGPQDRIPQRASRREAAFAKLCAACPIPASSGKTQRHRLNRGGDRRANNALYTIVLVRMRYHPPTQAYVARRTAEGKTRAEIMRCLKRFVAREIYNIITNPPAIPTGHDLRRRRLQNDVTLTALANALNVAPIRLSHVERGLDYNNDIARRADTWLTQHAA